MQSQPFRKKGWFFRLSKKSPAAENRRKQTDYTNQ